MEKKTNSIKISGKKYQLNIKPSPFDARDYVAESIFPPLTALRLPTKLDLRADLMDIRDQGTQGTCFYGKSKVLMEDYSYKEIRKIKKGEVVITHLGNKKKVTNTFKRIWQGNMYKIKCFGISDELYCTPEHPILVANEWKDAKDLTEDDYLAIPILNIEEREKINYRGYLKDFNYYSKITSIEKESQFIGGYVYNLEVEDDNSYIVNSIAVHNCAAMSSACMKEWEEFKDIGLLEYLSPQFIYDNRENQNSEGMYPRDVMKILQEKGVCIERYYPYGKPQKPSQISEEAKEDAKNFRIDNYARINTIEGLKEALWKQGPCLIAVPVYNYGKRMWKPEKQGQEAFGGHAMSVTGYNKEGFIIRNSWSDSWGDKGYTIFPYEDWGLQWEVWSTIDDVSTKPYSKYNLKSTPKIVMLLRKFKKKISNFWHKYKIRIIIIGIAVLIIIGYSIFSIINVNYPCLKAGDFFYRLKKYS